MIETRTYEEVTQICLSHEMSGKPLYWVAAYLVDGLLIDTGCAHTSREFADYLQNEDIRVVVNTHFHEDHCGGNRHILERFDVPLYAHRDSIPLIAHKPRLYPYQEVVWGCPEPTVPEPIPDIIETDYLRFRVVETPGHSPGHVCLVEESRGWCFSGDIYAREGMKFIRPEEDMKATIASMESLIDLSCERLVLFTSPGRIVEEGRAALAACIDNLRGLAARVSDLHRQGASPDEMVTELFGGEHLFAEITNNQYTTKNLVLSLLDMGEGSSKG